LKYKNKYLELKIQDGGSKNIKSIKNDDIDNKNKLYRKFYKDWWQKLANGSLIFVYNDKSYKIYTSNKKTHITQSKEIQQKWKEMTDDPTVKMIIVSAQSSDSLESFVTKFIGKNKNITNLLNTKNSLEIIMENPKKYFTKDNNKDYWV
jgi:hypothetical protein